MKANRFVQFAAVGFCAIASAIAVTSSSRTASASGFMPIENYPYPGGEFSLISADNTPVAWPTFEALYSDYAFPQSADAIYSLLGQPIGYEGAWDYYPLPNGGQMAIYYVGKDAVYFTTRY